MIDKKRKGFFKYNEKECNILDQIDEDYAIILSGFVEDDCIESLEKSLEIKSKYPGLWEFYQEVKHRVYIPPVLFTPFPQIWLHIKNFYVAQADDDRFLELELVQVLREAKLYGVTKLAFPRRKAALPHFKDLIFKVFGEESIEVLVCVDDEGILNIQEPDMEKQNFDNKSKYI